MASLEDASLMGLEVDIGATMVTIQSPRRELLQRQEVSGGWQAMPGLREGSVAWHLKEHFVTPKCQFTCPPVRLDRFRQAASKIGPH